MLSMKFKEGGWLTLAATIICISFCFLIRHHYRRVARRIQEIDRALEDIPGKTNKAVRFDSTKPTAIILVGGIAHLGKHCLLTVFRLFPESFHNAVFVSIGVVDSDVFKGKDQLEALEKETCELLQVHVEFAGKLGIPAQSVHAIGTDVVEEASKLCLELSKNYPRTVIFSGELVFDEPRWYDGLLHNETAYAIQRRLRFACLPVVILPMRLTRRKSPPAKI
jgi:hypothetical protein